VKQVDRLILREEPGEATVLAVTPLLLVALAGAMIPALGLILPVVPVEVMVLSLALFLLVVLGVVTVLALELLLW
jgi:hypothetical protein